MRSRRHAKRGCPPLKQAQLQMALGLDRANAGDSPQEFLKEVAAAEKLIDGCHRTTWPG